MKNKLKKIFKNRIFIFVLSGILFSTVTASAITYFDSKNVTYNNETSGLSSKNVQGAIDELYNECFPPIPPGAGDTILEEVPIVTTGDGLYKDEYEEGRYFYKGKNVNNYITFNNEKWRIISIESDKTLKIMRDAILQDITWDSSGGTNGSNNWARPADLNTYLNENYYNSLNSISQSQIVAKNWNVGNVTYDNNDLAEQMSAESGKKWNGKVALITASEYIRSNSNQSSCGTFEKINVNYQLCQDTTWMHIYSTWWTLSPAIVNSTNVFIVNSGGGMQRLRANNAAPFRPVVYLSSEVKITGGNGTQGNPFILK